MRGAPMARPWPVLVFASLVLVAFVQPRAQSADGAALFARHCATCHEGAGDGRAPSRSALAERSPESILERLDGGIMATQAAALSDAERRTIAEYLTGRTLPSDATAARDGRPRQEPGQQAGAAFLSPEELRRQTTRDTTIPFVPVPQVDQASSRGWPLHNLDLMNSRYSPLNQINTSNIKSVAVRWLYHTRNSGATPIVVDGMMYVTTSDGVVALDASTGRPVWSNTSVSSNRGATYGDGRIYVARDARLWALDARTGKAVDSFG